MNKIQEYIIDYDLVEKFDLNTLKSIMCLPILKNDYYILCAVNKENKSNVLKENEYFKEFTSSCEEINFYLSDFKIRHFLFTHVKKSIQYFNDTQNFASIFLEQLIEFALIKKASDIHLETTSTAFMIRFRIDGRLKHFFNFDMEFYPIISSIIKLRCNLDITQKRVSMDGRFSLNSDKKIDIRVSTMPIITGESIVLRILDDFDEQIKMHSLGFSNAEQEFLKSIITRPNGLILVTGPTGSGKTTTLYTLLKLLNCEDKKIMTIEDPIEYQLDRIQQISVNDELNMSFGEILKTILRQDPDIIMVGEIRDAKSLEIALQASLTGHLVLSTLHTNSCIETLNRLYDLKAPNYILASALKAVISQKLIIKRCTCIDGCIECNFTKMNGRTVLSEILDIDKNISNMIREKKSLNHIIDYAKNNGFKTLREDALNKVRNNITTKDEVLKLLGYLDEEI